MSQQVLPLLPADAVAIGPLAGLVETGEGGVVFVSGQATFAFAAGDEVGRRLAAVQLVEAKIASVAAVTAGFGLAQATLWRWRAAFATDGVAGLIPGKRGPKAPSKLTDAVAARIRELDGQGLRLTAIGQQVGVSTATVRVALGRRAGSAGWRARHGVPDSDAGVADGAIENTGADIAADGEDAGQDDADRDDADLAEDTGDAAPVLPVLPAPVPRVGERAWPVPGYSTRRRWCSRRVRTCRWPGC